MAKHVVIAGGGTGGHLYPGIALARTLMRHDKDIEVTFVGTRHGIEAKVLPREGLRLKTILSSGILGKKGLKRWLSWCKLPIGITQSIWFLAKTKPDLVVGVGGYVSGPLVLSSWLLRIPILIHEQNVTPGITNKLLGKIADKIAVSFKQSRRFFPAHKVVETGNMIREEFSELKKETARANTEKFCVLVLGGSQGAHSINMAIIDALKYLTDTKDSLHFIHQTGQADAETVQQSYADKGFSADVQPFIYDMLDAYKKASLVVCRAGATTLAEITSCGKVSILIPFPHAAHQHQEHNASMIKDAGACEMIHDQEINGENLSGAILRAMREPDRLKEMEEKSYNLGRRDATEKVRQLCMELLEKSRPANFAGQPSKKNNASCIWARPSASIL